MLPLIDPPLFESITTGLLCLGVIGMAGMVAVVVLVAASMRAQPRPRATVTPLGRRLPEAA